MKTAICAIAKCENRYIKEWVDYHLALGFTHIYIWDNNIVDGERIEDVLIGYENSVSILDCRGKLAFQTKAYTQVYNEYGSRYDWIAFIDVDEFITFSENSKIQFISDFLNRFPSNIQVVRLNWMCYGDNDIIELEDFSVLRRFTQPLSYDKCVQYDFPENNHIKSIIRGGMYLGKATIAPHRPEQGEFVVANAEGEIGENVFFQPYSYQTAYIRHYVTKTIGEWMLKISRGLATSTEKNELYKIDQFFLYNRKTKEKENIIHLYELLVNSYQQNNETQAVLLKIENDKLREELVRVNKSYQGISNSYAYKLGKILLRPFSLLKK